jgi:hypothetical protein
VRLESDEQGRVLIVGADELEQDAAAAEGPVETYRPFR